jgi:NAD(P)-dependent dehydrogenase (short-subunit alcohol dehydrogenase family)
MKTAVITGANSGMGFITAKALAQKGYLTIMVCRNEAKAKAAAEEIVASSGNSQVHYYICDLSDIKAVKQLTSKIISDHPTIDVLVNNAGLYIDQRKVSAQGYELTFANNHLSYFAMTQGLLPALRSAPEARIVNVASEAQQYGKLDFTDLQLEKKYKAMLAYGNSKLYNIMFTLELAKRLQGTHITANCMHPGGVRTNFAKGAGGLVGFIFNLLGFMLRSPEKGADTIIWLATADELKGTSGQYFFDRKPIKAQTDAYKEENLKRLWSISEDMYHNA